MASRAMRLSFSAVGLSGELSPDYTPYEAGLGFAVRLDKTVPFIGREALLRQKEEGVKRRLAFFTLDDPQALPLGGESILLNGEPVGEVTSAAYGHTLGCAVGLGYVHDAGGVDRAFIESGTYHLDIAGETFAATAHMRTPYDPRAERVRG